MFSFHSYRQINNKMKENGWKEKKNSAKITELFHKNPWRPCWGCQSCTDPELRYSNTEESVFYFLRRKYNLFWAFCCMSRFTYDQWTIWDIVKVKVSKILRVCQNVGKNVDFQGNRHKKKTESFSSKIFKIS